MIFVDRTLKGLLLALSLMLAWCGTAAAEEARLASGDVVRIAVYGQNDLSTVARISSDGEITFPLIGEVAIGGLTTREAEGTIARLLSERNIVKNPQVTLFVEQRRSTESDALTILGQVKNPGRYSANSLSEGGAETVVGLLALAGGVTDSAADRLILTREEGGKEEKLEVDLVALLRNGDLSQNHTLHAGDVVFVPSMEVFYVYGEVNRPGRFRLERNMTVMQAIAVSGGLAPGADEKGLTIKRRAGTEVATLKASLTDALRPDDVLIVDEALF